MINRIRADPKSFVSDIEKAKELNQTKDIREKMMEKVEIYKEPLPNGQLLKKITLAFPEFYNGEELREICWDEKFTGETVVLLSRA